MTESPALTITNATEKDVLDWNRSAIGFYQALGAEPLSDWTVFRLKGDALERLAASN